MLCNYLQNVAAITYIFVLQLSTFLFYNKHPDLFIKDIAAMVGFSDQFYFSRIFHSITGMSPAEYMKNHKGISCDAKS